MLAILPVVLFHLACTRIASDDLRPQRQGDFRAPDVDGVYLDAPSGLGHAHRSLFELLTRVPVDGSDDPDRTVELAGFGTATPTATLRSGSSHRTEPIRGFRQSDGHLRRTEDFQVAFAPPWWGVWGTDTAVRPTRVGALRVVYRFEPAMLFFVLLPLPGPGSNSFPTHDFSFYRVGP